MQRDQDQPALCGLGQGAPNPVETILKHFRGEYEAHIYEKRCPAKVCKALIRYDIIMDALHWLYRMRSKLPRECHHGERRQTHVIDPEVCVRCGICMQVCNFNAVQVVRS